MQESVPAPTPPASSDVSQDSACSSWLAVTEKWIEHENTDLQGNFYCISLNTYYWRKVKII